MDGSLFQTGVNSWHDFYIAAGSASAALLGLLFVGERATVADITWRAGLTKRTFFRHLADKREVLALR